MSDAEMLEYDKNRSGKWVTVASFSHAGMANVAKLQLDAEEIPNYIDNEHSATMLWYIQPAVGGVRVKVPEEYEEEALEVLRNEDPDEEDQDDDDDDAADDEAQYADQGYNQLRYSSVTRCPKCHSTDTEPLSWSWRVVQTVVVLLLGAFALGHVYLLVLLIAYAAYFLYSKPSHRCFRCRHRFNATAMGG